jgi:magnesium chelatase family protein
VSIARAGSTVRYPAQIQLVLAFNPCPCGNLGRSDHVCRCTDTEISRYWRRVGGALLDRIDLRVPLEPVPAAQMCLPVCPDDSAEKRESVRKAAARQKERYRGLGFAWNSRIPPGLIDTYCPLGAAARATLLDAGRQLSLSSRAFHSVLRMARTIADLAGEEEISPEHIREASDQRRYGDNDFFWRTGRG